MMGIINKILEKEFAFRIGPLLRKFLHTNQSGYNILVIQLEMEHVQNIKQQMAMLQLDFAKAFDYVIDAISI